MFNLNILFWSMGDACFNTVTTGIVSHSSLCHALSIIICLYYIKNWRSSLIFVRNSVVLTKPAPHGPQHQSSFRFESMVTLIFPQCARHLCVSFLLSLRLLQNLSPYLQKNIISHPSALTIASSLRHEQEALNEGTSYVPHVHGMFWTLSVFEEINNFT